MTNGNNRQIDECYNPNILLDKATLCYEIIRKRSNLVTDNDVKLNAILDIVKENTGKQIMIISKRGEFAARVTAYLEENGIDCGDYHDAIEPRVLVDENGIPVLYKSGANKGKPRIVKSKAISSANERLFQQGQLKVLSVKNSSSDELQIAVDVWILTSPLCDEVAAIKNSNYKILFKSEKNIIYYIYKKR